MKKLQHSRDLTDEPPKVFLLVTCCLVQDVGCEGAGYLHVLKQEASLDPLLVDVKRGKELFMALDTLNF